MIEQRYLKDSYLNKGLSASVIATKLGCSENKVNYWIRKYDIKKRTIADAIYLKSNPNGDPFSKSKLNSDKDWFLFGLGLGLYWREGTKSNKHSIRLGNTDPHLVKKFIEFLEHVYQIDTTKLHYGLQIFSDMPKDKALKFWMRALCVDKSQFQKVIVTPARSIGNYRNKTQHGVLTVHFNNKKLRDIIVGAINDLQSDKMPS